MFRRVTGIQRLAALRRVNATATLTGVPYYLTTSSHQILRSTSTLSSVEAPPEVRNVARKAYRQPPFTKILAANRGEIATRINRAAAEVGSLTAGIYSYEGM
jgi:hypothetical protein